MMFNLGRYSLFGKAAFFASCYGLFFYVTQFFLAKTGILPNYPDANNLHHWDVGFYSSIAENGYDAQSDNTGFYILFPLIWRASHLGIWGIIVLNIAFFAAGFGLLMKTLDQRGKEFWLLCLTLPAGYFAFVPYTESLFFLFGAWLLYAVVCQKRGQIFVVLVLISLVRATAFFLLPALLAVELLANSPKKALTSTAKYLSRYVIPILLGLVIFIVWQYVETDIWWAYFKKQSTVWGHTFSWPEIHFSNIENADWRHHWLSALAMFVDAIAAIFLLGKIFRWIKLGETEQNRGLLLSMGYLSMVLMSLLFLNPKYGGNHTNVMGANRYTFITPFFMFVLHHFYQYRFSNKLICLVLIGLAGFLALFRAYFSLHQFIIVGLVPIFLVLAFLLSRRNADNIWLLIAIIAFNLFIQLHHFQQFIGKNLYMD